MDRANRARRFAARVSLTFTVASVVWIVASDIALEALFGVRFEGWADVAKGVAFVVVLGLLLYGLVVRTHGREIEMSEALARQSELDVQLFQSSPEAMWVYDPETLEILEVNDTMVEAYGIERSELLSMHLTDLSPPGEREALRRVIAGLGPRGDPHVWLHVDGSGEHRWVEVTSHAIEREGRRVRLAVGRDVSAQRRAEEALRASERRLAGVLASMQEMAFSIDLDTRRIAYLNEVATEVLGREPDELLMPLRDFSQLVLEEDRPHVRRALDEVVEKGWTEVEVRVRNHRDEVRTLRLRGSAVLSADGEVHQIDGVAIDMTRRHELESLVVHQRSFDQLTGLAVRRAFLTAVDAGIGSSVGVAPPAVVAMFDLDRFADVNETAGHEVGDHLLVAVAQRLGTVLEPGMVAARVGGDEFAVFCPAGMASSRDLGSRVRAAVEGPFLVEDHEFFIGLSVGLVEAAPGMGSDDLIRDAHLAMSAAKVRTSGIEVFEPRHRVVAVDRVQVERDLRRAIAEDQLVAVFQPEIDLQTQRLVAVEALVRWDHPKRGLVSAGEFIIEAERSNLIIDIGDLMLRRALCQAAQWHRSHGRRAPVTWINLSRRELDDPRVVDRVLQAVEEAEVPVSLVGVEVTETAFVADGGSGVQSLTRLAEAGVALALDDFGTGWSSLMSLKSFPLTTVKIDRSFVVNVAREVHDRQIVRAIVGMAHGLSLTTLAEGVETEEQLEALTALGCDAAQGYLLGRPEPAAAIDALLDAGGRPEAMRPLSA